MDFLQGRMDLLQGRYFTDTAAIAPFSELNASLLHLYVFPMCAAHISCTSLFLIIDF